MQQGRGLGTLLLARHRSGDPAGCLTIEVPAPNSRTVGGWLYVPPDWRGRGVGRELLREAGSLLDDVGIEAVKACTVSTIPAAEALARRLEGRIVMSRQIHEAVLAEMDTELLRWRSETRRDPDVRVQVFEGRYPRDDMDDLAALRASIYSVHGHELTRPQVLQTLLEFESVMERRGLRRVAVLAREDGAGRVVGIAEAIWNPESPRLLSDWHVALVKERHGRKVGGALIVTLLLEVMQRLPTVRVVRIATHKAASPVHRRLESIGLVPRHEETHWTISTEAIRTYVSAGAPAASRGPRTDRAIYRSAAPGFARRPGSPHGWPRASPGRIRRPRPNRRPRPDRAFRRRLQNPRRPSAAAPSRAAGGFPGPDT